MIHMTQAQIEEFVAPPRHAVLATNRKDSPPQISSVWYAYEGGKFYVSASSDTAKFRNLRRDRRVSLCIDACHPDARAVIVYGTASLLEPTAPQVQQIRWRIIRRYYEREEDARQYVEATREMPSGIIIITPQKMIGQDFN